MPLALTAYRVAGRALSPFAGAWLGFRAYTGKEDPARLQERFGRATLARPEGTLVWLHGASVGEARVLLSVRDALAAARPELNFLITTGTRTSAQIVGADRHARTHHQFAVLDQDGPARRFLDHWRPHLAVFAESEIWPNLVIETARRGVPLALINACMGAKSLAGWARAPDTARRVFSSFDLILAADQPTAAGLERLTGKAVAAAGNLKLTAAPAPPDARDLERWRAILAGRDVWIAASTHEGEDEIVLEAQAALRWRHENALLIIAPRHPKRGAAIAALARGAPRRTLGQTPGASDGIYIVDTLGELALFFTLAPVALMGGSLIPPLEGHNPVEPTACGAAVIVGPFVSSFAEIYAALDEAGGLSQVGDAASIAARVASLWEDAPAREAQTAAARAVIAGASPVLTRTTDALLALLTVGAHAPA